MFFCHAFVRSAGAMLVHMPCLEAGPTLAVVDVIAKPAAIASPRQFASHSSVMPLAQIKN